MSAGPQPKADSVRLQKLLAEAGAGSRRALEKRIAAGEVFVNGKPAELGSSARAGDQLKLDEQEWRVRAVQPEHHSLVYNKPTGELTTRADPQDRPTVFDRLPALESGRWVAVGRLDFNTTGLLLLTTDGDLAHAMMHPSNRVEREYACRILGQVTPEMLDRLRTGVELDDGMAYFSDITDAGGSGENHWYHVTLLEGRNREVRRLWASQGVLVSRLKRVRYGTLFLPHRLRVGSMAELPAAEHERLRADVGLPPSPVRLELQSLSAGKEEGRRRGRRPKAATRSRGKPSPLRKAAKPRMDERSAKPDPARKNPRDRKADSSRKSGPGSKTGRRRP